MRKGFGYFECPHCGEKIHEYEIKKFKTIMPGDSLYIVKSVPKMVGGLGGSATQIRTKAVNQQIMSSWTVI